VKNIIKDSKEHLLALKKIGLEMC